MGVEERPATLLHAPGVARSSTLTRAASFSSPLPLLLEAPSTNPHLLFTRRPLPPASPGTFPHSPSASISREARPSIEGVSVFPPNLHEGLHVEAGPKADCALASVPVEERDREEEEDEKGMVEEEAAGEVGLGLGSYGSGLGLCLRRRVEDVAGRLWAAGKAALCSSRDYGEKYVWEGEKEKFGYGTRFNASVAALVTAAVTVAGLVYARRRDRREQNLLLMLLQEKDKRISQLLHQIALMSNLKATAIADAVISKV